MSRRPVGSCLSPRSWPLRKGSRSRCGRFNKRVTLANRETPTAGERLQVPACLRNGGQRQLTLFWTLLVGQPATQSIVIHADPGSNRCVSIPRLRGIPPLRSQQLIGANYTLFLAIDTSSLDLPRSIRPSSACAGLLISLSSLRDGYPRSHSETGLLAARSERVGSHHRFPKTLCI